MTVSSSSRFVGACIAALAFGAAPAFAQRAEIVYAGQGAPQQTAALEGRLAGGSDRSYGYGGERRGNGAVIDIRRTGSAPRSQPEPTPTSEQGARPEWLEQEQVGPPYEAGGRWYVPTPEPGYEQTGTASWYGPNFHGEATASGEAYDQEAMTAAHPTLPLQSLVQVTNLENGREVIVRVNDRGPFVGERLIDLSRAAADVLGFENAGHARVHVRYLGPAPRRVNANGGDAPTLAPQAEPRRELEAAEGEPMSLVVTDTAPAQEAPTLQQAAYTPRAPLPVQGAFVVQIGAYSDLANAHRVRDAVGRAGPVSIDVRRTALGLELFRVRVGPWTRAAEAETARQVLSDLGYGEAVVTQR